MNTSTNRLTEVVDAARRELGDAGDSMALRSVGDADLARMTTEAGALLRAAEALVLVLGGEAEARSQSATREERFTVRQGCRNSNEFLQRATGISASTAARWLRVAEGIRPLLNAITGEPLLAPLPMIREAAIAGELSADAIFAIAAPLLAVRTVADPAAFEAADRELAGVATERGECSSLAPTATADELRIMASMWAMALDPDGREPIEARAVKRRALSLGVLRDGLVPISGSLLPEVAAQLQRISDATSNPRVRGVHFVEQSAEEVDPAEKDPRTAVQKLHDALATALSVAAASDRLPTVGGAAPTLVVHVTEDALASGQGTATASGFNVSLAAAHQVGCAGAVQRVVANDAGRIVRIGTEERVFNRHQRRAIALRDGGCIIPGCDVRAEWCEVHHVTEHAHGGPTHTDNGVLLCWNHHRFLATGGWNIRMSDGIPETQAPAWLDPSRRWRRHRPPRARVDPAPRT